jgi:hypothetical protein
MTLKQKSVLTFLIILIIILILLITIDILANKVVIKIDGHYYDGLGQGLAMRDAIPLYPSFNEINISVGEIYEIPLNGSYEITIHDNNSTIKLFKNQTGYYIEGVKKGTANISFSKTSEKEVVSIFYIVNVN